MFNNQAAWVGTLQQIVVGSLAFAATNLDLKDNPAGPARAAPVDNGPDGEWLRLRVKSLLGISWPTMPNLVCLNSYQRARTKLPHRGSNIP